MLSSRRTFVPFSDLHKVTKVVEYKRRYDQVLTTEPKYSPKPPHKPIAGELRIEKKKVLLHATQMAEEAR